MVDAYVEACSKGSETLEKLEEGMAGAGTPGKPRFCADQFAVRQRGRKKLAFG